MAHVVAQGNGGAWIGPCDAMCRCAPSSQVESYIKRNKLKQTHISGEVGVNKSLLSIWLRGKVSAKQDKVRGRLGPRCARRPARELTAARSHPNVATDCCAHHASLDAAAPAGARVPRYPCACHHVCIGRALGTAPGRRCSSGRAAGSPAGVHAGCNGLHAAPSTHADASPHAHEPHAAAGRRHAVAVHEHDGDAGQPGERQACDAVSSFVHTGPPRPVQARTHRCVCACVTLPGAIA